MEKVQIIHFDNLTHLDAVQMVCNALREGIKDGETINWERSGKDVHGFEYKNEGVEYDEHPNYGDNSPLFYCYRS